MIPNTLGHANYRAIGLHIMPLFFPQHQQKEMRRALRFAAQHRLSDAVKGRASHLQLLFMFSPTIKS